MRIHFRVSMFIFKENKSSSPTFSIRPVTIFFPNVVYMKFTEFN